VAKRKKKEEAKILPDLALVSFSDMMTLMLTFFVLLFSMSEIRKEKVIKAISAMRQQLGIMPAMKSPNQIFIPAQKLSQTQANLLRQGPPGKNPDVMTLADDQRLRFIIGGAGKFARNSAVLEPEVRAIIANNVVPDLAGYRNRIEIRGHAAPDEDLDPWRLGSDRAEYVLHYLTREKGLDESRFRVVSCGANEPYNPNDPDSCRIVEIVMTEYMVKSPGEQ
jgi:chemotaxis protein MotB